MIAKKCLPCATHLAPHVRRVLVDKSLRRVAEEKLGDNEQSNFLLAI